MKHPLFLLAILLSACSLATSGTQNSAQQIVYKNNFETGAGPEWSKTAVDTTPAGARKFLGRFGDKPVKFQLANLPAHSAITIDFDLLILDSWDGNNAQCGPDTWTLAIEGGPTLVYTSFSNVDSPAFPQSFPDTYPNGSHKRFTGAAESNTLGYNREGNSVYRFTLKTPHTSDLVSYLFSSTCSGDPLDESWGLDNVTVSIASTEEEARAHYLAGENAFSAGDYQKAIAEWEQTLKLKPTSEHTRKMLAKARTLVPTTDTRAQPEPDEWQTTVKAALDKVVATEGPKTPLPRPIKAPQQRLKSVYIDDAFLYSQNFGPDRQFLQRIIASASSARGSFDAVGPPIPDREFCVGRVKIVNEGPYNVTFFELNLRVPGDPTARMSPRLRAARETFPLLPVEGNLMRPSSLRLITDRRIRPGESLDVPVICDYKTYSPRSRKYITLYATLEGPLWVENEIMDEVTIE